MSELDILVVEDNHGDVHLIERAFETRDLPGTVHVVKTGDEALDWLFQRDEYADAPRPDLVLLDLNLPATNGHTVLQRIKSDPNLKRLPVIVVTSSRSEEDLIEAYETAANACLIKPVDPETYADLVQSLVTFWGKTVSLPPAVDDIGDMAK